jgi:hypothetical protein
MARSFWLMFSRGAFMTHVGRPNKRARANGHAATLHARQVSSASLLVSLDGLTRLYGRRSALER